MQDAKLPHWTSASLLLLAIGCGSEGMPSDDALDTDAATVGNEDDAGGDPGDADDGDVDDGGDDGDGANEGNYDVSDFDWEDPRGESFTPLTKKSFRAIASDELAILLPNAATGHAGIVLDDRVEAGDVRTLVNSSAGEVFDMVRGDVDDDGQDEGLAVRIDEGGTVRLTMLENRDGTMTETTVHTLPGSHTWARIAVADMDDDLRDEITVAVIDATNTLRIYVFDDLESFATLELVEMPDTQMYDIATGDFDGDDLSELVVLRMDGSGVIRAHFFSNLTGAFVETDVLEGSDLPVADAGYTVNNLRVVAGDIDDDGRDEVVFAALRRSSLSGFNELRVFAHDDAAEGRSFLEDLMVVISLDDWPRDHRIGWHLAMADTNGDQRKEVVSLMPDLDAKVGGQRRHYLDHFSFMNAALGDARFTAPHVRREVAGPVQSQAGGWLTVLDDRRSGRDTVAMTILDLALPDDPGTLRQLELHRFFVTDEPTPPLVLTSSVEIMPVQTLPSQTESWINPVVVGLDLDGDGFKVQYTGKKWLSLPDPFVLVVMAAPPVQAELNQNHSSSATAYGHQVTSGNTHAEEISTTVGATVSFESPSLFDVFSVQASTSIEREFGKTHTVTEMATYGTSYSGSALDDYVIFQGTLYTSYEYEVVSSPDPAAIGTRMTIDEPVDTKVYKWTVDYFNASIPDPVHHIGEDVFVHSPGEVASYGDKARRDHLLAVNDGWRSEGKTTVGKGNGSNRTYIDLSEEVVDTTTLEITKSVSAGASVAGVGFEVSRSIKEGQEWSITVGESVVYEGEVGDLAENAEYADYSYSYGLMVWNYDNPEKGRAFQVIDYWVEDLGPGHRPN